MASTINAITSGAGGIVTTGDSSGIVAIQSNGTTYATISVNGITFPSWTTATRPASPTAGSTGYNTDIQRLETYSGTTWISSSTAITYTASYLVVAGGGGGGGNGNTTAGGGGGGPASSANGANGGSGVVILSVPTANYSGSTTGSPTITTSGSNTIIKWTTGSGTYTA